MSEAIHLCKRYGPLAEKISSIYEKDKVVSVVISPSDRLNKYLFLEIYKELKCPDEALAFYKHSMYDIIIIFQVRDKENEWYFKELYLFFEGYGITVKCNEEILNG